MVLSFSGWILAVFCPVFFWSFTCKKLLIQKQRQAVMVSQFDWFDIKAASAYLCFGLLSPKKYKYQDNDRF